VNDAHLNRVTQKFVPDEDRTVIRSSVRLPTTLSRSVGTNCAKSPAPQGNQHFLDFEEIGMRAVLNWTVGGGLLLAAMSAMAADGTAPLLATADATVANSSATDTGDTAEVVVTGLTEHLPAAKSLQDQQDIPRSVSIVTGQELESLDALNITEVYQRLGNIQWNFGNPMTGSLSIRGVSNPATGTTVDPSLGVVVDGVTYAFLPLSTQLDFVDVASVSVTRGPQGSTGGQNNSLGTITVTNNAPSFTPEAHGTLTLGELQSVIATAAITGPVIDDLLAYRITFYRDQQQGPYNDAYFGNIGRNSWDNTDRTLGRAQFLLTPTNDLSVLASFTLKPKGVEFTNGLTQYVQQPYSYANGAADYQPDYLPNGAPNPAATNTAQNKFTRSYFTNSVPNAYQQYLAYPVLEYADQGIQNGEYGGLVKVTWDLPDVIFNSVTSVQHDFFEASNGTTAWDITTDGGVYAQYTQESEEFSFTSKPGNFFDYKAGMFYLHSYSYQDSRNLYGGDAGAYYANASQYNALSTNGEGTDLLINSLDGAYQESKIWTSNTTAAAFGSIDWHLTQPLTLTTGFRITNENRQTSQLKAVTVDGFGGLLDPAGSGDGFNTTSTGALGANNSAQQIAWANQLAQQYFGVGTYSALTAAELKQVATAKAVRSGNIYNQLYPYTVAQPYRGNLPTGTVSLTYKFTPDLTAYTAWQHGAKAGISQISGVDEVGNPVSRLVKPEKSDDFELGLKGGYLNDTLIVNADVYYDKVKDYQQTVTIFDPILTAQNNNIAVYDSITGNAPAIELSGLEVDAVYTGVRHLTLRFAGDYSHAFYDADVLLANPVEDGNVTPAYRDAVGQTLYNAPRYTGNFSGEYAIPVLRNGVFHANFNYHYTARENSDAANSQYAWIGGYGLADLGIGLGRRDRKFDVNFIVKNAFNTSYVESRTWASFVPGIPRWYGVAFSATL
jgi:iron complex outermembrane recepter protein